MSISISLTSISERLEKLPLVLRSLLDQTVKPEGIHVYLSKEPFGIDKGCQTLPRPLQILFATEALLHLHWVPNTGPHTKLIPFTLTHPNHLVLTVDDDYVYHNKLVEVSLNLWAEHKCCISYNCVTFTKDMPYTKWPQEKNTLSFTHFTKGNAGVLYHTSWFQDSRFFDSTLFQSVCPKADDIWFNCWRMKLKIPCFFSGYVSRQKSLSHTLTLFQTNETENDRQLAATLKLLEEISSPEADQNELGGTPQVAQ